jgi:hypothetical protein
MTTRAVVRGASAGASIATPQDAITQMMLRHTERRTFGGLIANTAGHKMFRYFLAGD